MGISGLLPALKGIVQVVHVSKYRGAKVAIDGYSWLHKGAYCCSQELCEGVYTDKFVGFCLSRLEMLRSNGVTPVVVFDGARLPLKGREEEMRRRMRQEARDKAAAHAAAGNISAALECYQRAVDVTPEMAKQVIEACKERGYEYLVAPYEADAQMAYLARLGAVAAVITEDSDLLAYGCPRVLFKMDRTGMGEELCLADLPHNKGLSFAGFSHDMFVQMCIMAGCDFLGGLPGIGIKKAHQNIKRFKSFVKAAKALRFAGTSVPRDYEVGFQRALWAFRHQRIYCPQRRQVVHLTPVPGSGIGAADVECVAAVPESPIERQALSFLGPHLDGATAHAVAVGDLHPDSKQPFDLAAIYKGCANPPPLVATALAAAGGSNGDISAVGSAAGAGAGRTASGRCIRIGLSKRKSGAWTNSGPAPPTDGGIARFFRPTAALATLAGEQPLSRAPLQAPAKRLCVAAPAGCDRATPCTSGFPAAAMHQRACGTSAAPTPSQPRLLLMGGLPPLSTEPSSPQLTGSQGPAPPGLPRAAVQVDSAARSMPEHTRYQPLQTVVLQPRLPHLETPSDMLEAPSASRGQFASLLQPRLGQKMGWLAAGSALDEEEEAEARQLSQVQGASLMELQAHPNSQGCGPGWGSAPEASEGARAKIWVDDGRAISALASMEEWDAGGRRCRSLDVIAGPMQGLANEHAHGEELLSPCRPHPLAVGAPRRSGRQGLHRCHSSGSLARLLERDTEHTGLFLHLATTRGVGCDSMLAPEQGAATLGLAEAQGLLPGLAMQDAKALGMARGFWDEEERPMLSMSTSCSLPSLQASGLGTELSSHSARPGPPGSQGAWWEGSHDSQSGEGEPLSSPLEPRLIVEPGSCWNDGSGLSPRASGKGTGEDTLASLLVQEQPQHAQSGLSLLQAGINGCVVPPLEGLGQQAGLWQVHCEQPQLASTLSDAGPAAREPQVLGTLHAAAGAGDIEAAAARRCQGSVAEASGSASGVPDRDAVAVEVLELHPQQATRLTAAEAAIAAEAAAAPQGQAGDGAAAGAEGCAAGLMAQPCSALHSIAHIQHFALLAGDAIEKVAAGAAGRLTSAALPATRATAAPAPLRPSHRHNLPSLEDPHLHRIGKGSTSSVVKTGPFKPPRRQDNPTSKPSSRNAFGRFACGRR